MREVPPHGGAGDGGGQEDGGGLGHSGEEGSHRVRESHMELEEHHTVGGLECIRTGEQESDRKWGLGCIHKRVPKIMCYMILNLRVNIA